MTKKVPENPSLFIGRAIAEAFKAKGLGRARYDENGLEDAIRKRDKALEEGERAFKKAIREAGEFRDAALENERTIVDRKLRRQSAKNTRAAYKALRAEAFRAHEAAKETAWTRFREDKRSSVLESTPFIPEAEPSR